MERDDKNQGEDEFGNGAAEFEEAARRHPQPFRLDEVLRGDKAPDEGADGAGDRADIGDEQGLAEQRQPFVLLGDAPEPFRDVGEDEGAAVEMEQAADIAGEIADIADEFRQAYFSDGAGCDRKRDKQRRAEQRLAAARGDLAVIGARERVSLGVRQSMDGARQASSPSGGREDFAPPDLPARTQDFLSESTNLMSLIVAS